MELTPNVPVTPAVIIKYLSALVPGVRSTVIEYGCTKVVISVPTDCICMLTVGPPPSRATIILRVPIAYPPKPPGPEVCIKKSIVCIAAEKYLLFAGDIAGIRC